MSNKKRVVTILEYLKENTNEDHPAKSEDIISYLEKQGYEVERKTVYNDIKQLNDMDYTIEKNHYGYYYNGDDFQLSELRVLTDAVKASYFLSEKRTNELVYKIARLTNKYDRKLVGKGEYVSIKTTNDYVLYNIDTIMQAIENKNTITFKYFIYNVDGSKEYKQNDYKAYPYNIVVNDGCYYLVCSHTNNTKKKAYVYRIDKMDSVKISSNRYVEADFDVKKFMDETFNMYAGERCNITLKCLNKYYEAVKQKFGASFMLIKKNKDYFMCNVDASISPTFYGWLFTFEGEITIVKPQNIKDEFVKRCQNLMNMHK